MLDRPAILLLLALGAVWPGLACAQDPASAPARRAAKVEVNVRMMLGDEARARLGNAWLPADAVGLFLVPDAAVDRNTNSDGVTAATIGPPGDIDFDSPARSVLAQLSSGSLAADVAAQVRERMQAATLEAGDLWNFDVVIAYYGLRSEQWRPAVQSGSASYCLVTAGTVNIGGAAGTLDRSEFQRGVDARSDGMPKPECRDLKDYAAGGATLLRRDLRELADVLAAWMVNRTLQGR